MRRSNRTRVIVVAFVASALFGAAACVDLFHSTDFDTLCEVDAAACPVEAEASVPDAKGNLDAGLDSGPPPPIDFCSNSPSSARGLAEHACGWLGACLGSREQSSFGSCMVRALSVYDCSFNPSLRPRGANADFWDCLSKVGSCKALEQCVFGNRAPECPVQDSGSFTACDRKSGGTVVVSCAGPARPVGMEPCALRGRTCTAVDPSTALCTGKLGADCKETPHCSGAFAVECKSAGGIYSDEGTDCAGVGDGRCVADDAGVACAPRADAGACKIANSSTIACGDGGTVESCVGGQAVRINCAAIGLTCNETGASSVDPLRACRAAPAAPSCGDAEDECDGKVLKSCGAGRPFALDCTKIPGLGACKQEAGRWAACTPP